MKSQLQFCNGVAVKKIKMAVNDVNEEEMNLKMVQKMKRTFHQMLKVRRIHPIQEHIDQRKRVIFPSLVPLSLVRILIFDSTIPLLLLRSFSFFFLLSFSIFLLLYLTFDKKKKKNKEIELRTLGPICHHIKNDSECYRTKLFGLMLHKSSKSLASAN